MTKKRISREHSLMLIAHVIAKRSTCDRLKVGAVAVREGRIIMTGYNGSPAWERHCDEIGHLIKCGHCVRTIHAEQNIIVQCAKYGLSLKNTTIYITHQPCRTCFNLLVSAGVKEILYHSKYGNVQYDRTAPVIIKQI